MPREMGCGRGGNIPYSAVVPNPCICALEWGDCGGLVPPAMVSGTPSPPSLPIRSARTGEAPCRGGGSGCRAGPPQKLFWRIRQADMWLGFTGMWAEADLGQGSRLCQCHQVGAGTNSGCYISSSETFWRKMSSLLMKDQFIEKGKTR